MDVGLHRLQDLFNDDNIEYFHGKEALEGEEEPRNIVGLMKAMHKALHEDESDRAFAPELLKHRLGQQLRQWQNLQLV